jgi:hypothetical protein
MNRLSRVLASKAPDRLIGIIGPNGITGATAESLHLRWIAIELLREYLDASKLRFEGFALKNLIPNGLAPRAAPVLLH